MKFYIEKDTYLTSHVAKVCNISIVNFSLNKKYMKELEKDYEKYFKIGNIAFIEIEDKSEFSKSIQKFLNIYEKSGKAINVKNFYPLNMLSKEFEISKSQIIDNKYDLRRYIDDIIDIDGKEFIKFNEELIKKFQKSYFYILDNKETDECYKQGYIDFSIRLGKNKNLVGY